MRGCFIPLLILLPFVSGRLRNFDGLVSRIGGGSDVVHGEYIIVFHDNADSDAVLTRIVSIAERQAEAPTVMFRYSVATNGVAMKGLNKDTVELLAQDKDIINIVELCTLSCLCPAFSPQ